MEEKFMEKTTRKLNDLLSQFLSLRNEVSEIADKTADAVFDSVESGDITKEEDFKPSKAQLQIIFKWAHDKADDFRVYLGDEFVNLDVLQCKINSAE